MKTVRLEGGPLELDGLEVPDRMRSVIIIDDADFVTHFYWVSHRWPEEKWVGEYKGVYEAPVR